MILALALAMFFQAAAPPAEKTATIPDGLLFNCWVRSNLSSEKSKVGDPVELLLADDLKDGSGNLIMPAKTRLTGTVTMAQKRSKNDKPALAIRLTQAQWKNGSAALNGVFGGDVMVKEHFEGMTGTHMTTHRGGDTFAAEGIEQAEGYTSPDDKLGAILYAKHDIKLTERNIVAILTIP
jgi:hypothetical protein